MSKTSTRVPSPGARDQTVVGASKARRAEKQAAADAKSAAEKRRLPRVGILARVAHGKGKPLEIDNASAHGLLLRGQAKDHPTLVAGADIELQLEPADHSGKPVALTARLVRVQYGERTEFGLEIVKMTDEARRAYYELLALAHLRTTPK